MWGRAFACAALGCLLFLAVLGTVASAADFSGTWSGNVTMRYYDPNNNLVSITEPAELDLSVSGSRVTGTLTLGGEDYPKGSWDVEGSGSGSSLSLSTEFGWDGATNQPCDMTFNVDGGSMTGSGTYENVGHLVTLTFDLDRGGSFAGIPGEVIAAGAIGAGAFGIITCLRPSPKVGLPPSGQPNMQQPQGHYQQYSQGQHQQHSQPPPESSYIRETQPHESVPMESGQSWGGAGLHEGSPINGPRWAGPGAPPRPRDWYRGRGNNDTPECPHCKTQGLRRYVKPYFRDNYDSGTWYCDNDVPGHSRGHGQPWNYGSP